MSADRVAVDANILVYAVYRDTPQHAASRAWLERAARGGVQICLTSQVLAEFFAIVTNSKHVWKPSPRPLGGEGGPRRRLYQPARDG